MNKIVIDTNVFISSILSKNSPPAKIMNLVSDQKLTLIYNLIILNEYKIVLSYDKFKIANEKQKLIIDEIINLGLINEPAKSTIVFSNESNRIFYDTAKNNNALLITGNIRHFPDEPFIMKPVDFASYINIMEYL